MPPLVTLADMQDELPGLSITPTTRPTARQVEGYIADTEAEVRARLVGLGAVWPTVPIGDAALFLRRTILEGVRYQVLRARYTFTRSEAQPEEIAFARDAYNDRLKALPSIAASLRAVTPVAVAGRTTPLVLRPEDAPQRGESFSEYTTRLDPYSVRRGVLPW